MEYDYEHEDDFAGRILWGRVAVYGVSLLLAFTLGWCASPTGAPQAEFDDQRDQISALAEENENLRNQLDALSAGDTEPPPDAEPPPEDQPAAGPTYEVQSGDTLNSIAQTRCGSTEFAGRIAELNGIDAANRLQVGQMLQLPPECT
jgi:hypothetical protein